MQSPAPETTIDSRFDKPRVPDVVAQMVQELLRAAAHMNHRSNSDAYLPETFLTRW